MVRGLAAPRQPLVGVMRRAQPVLVGLVSVLVVVAGVAFVFLPSWGTLRMSVTEVSGAQPFDRDITASYDLVSSRLATQRRWREVIYGKVTTAGPRVTRTVLRLRGVGPKTIGKRAKIAIGGPGTFRSVVHLRPGRYRWTVSLRVAGTAKKVSVVKRLRNGRSYLVRVRVHESGVVTFVPVLGY